MTGQRVISIITILPTRAGQKGNLVNIYILTSLSRQESERIRSEAVRLIREREDKTVTTQRDADRRIGERLGDEMHWRQELQSELELNINFTHQLETSRRNLEKALLETEGPLKVNTECIYNR